MAFHLELASVAFAARSIPASSVAKGQKTAGFPPATKKRRLTFGEEMIAGATARAAAQWVLFPMDLLKTRKQASV